MRIWPDSDPTAKQGRPREDAVSSAQGPVVLTIEEAAKRLGIGRTTMYSLVMSGEIRSVSIGRLRRVPVRCLDEYVDNLLNQSQQIAPAA
jgi:excisionase family DNA binding protein